MNKGKMIINENGIWYNLEEEATSIHEGHFTLEGFSFDDSLLFTWEELEDIKNRLEDM